MRAFVWPVCLQSFADAPQVFNRYDITILNPEKPWHSLAFGIFVQHDLWVRVTRRDPSREGAPIAVLANGKANGTLHEAPVEVAAES